MSVPTFKQFLSEAKGKSLADFARGNNDPVTYYPKTNTKRFMDEWNSRLGPWVRQAARAGNHVVKRVNMHEGETILDVVDDDNKLISTAVITGHDGVKSGDATIDFYNQTDIHQDNRYRVTPDNVQYEDGWVWREMNMQGASHQDTRNLPMSNKDIGNTGRVDDTTSPGNNPIDTSKPSDAVDDNTLDAPQPEDMADGQEFVPMSRASSPRKPADAAGAWAKLTKPKPGRKT